MAEARGHRVVVARRGNTIEPRAPSSPPADLVARLRERKADLLAILPDLARASDEAARVVVKFRLSTNSPNGWATCVGAAVNSK